MHLANLLGGGGEAALAAPTAITPLLVIPIPVYPIRVYPIPTPIQ